MKKALLYLCLFLSTYAFSFFEEELPGSMPESPAAKEVPRAPPNIVAGDEETPIQSTDGNPIAYGVEHPNFEQTIYSARPEKLYQLNVRVEMNQNFTGSLGYHYFYNPYFTVNPRFYYQSIENSSLRTAYYGPSVLFKFLYANPTMVTPYLAFGPGYQYWKFSQNDSPVVIGSGGVFQQEIGIQMNLTSHFALVLQQQITRYYAIIPPDPEDLEKNQPASAARINIMFEFII